MGQQLRARTSTLAACSNETERMKPEARGRSHLWNAQSQLAGVVRWLWSKDRSISK